jgi:hypothetical protein
MARTRITEKSHKNLLRILLMLKTYIDVLIFAGIWRSFQSPTLVELILAIGTASGAWLVFSMWMWERISACYDIVPEYLVEMRVAEPPPMEGHARIVEGTAP